MMKSIAILLLFPLFLLDLPAQCPNSSRPGVHVVQTGENLYRIAKRYKVSTQDLAQWNNISASITLFACQELSLTYNNTHSNALPTYNSTDEFTERGNRNNTSNSNNYTETTFVKQTGNKHIIREGETINGLANLYGYTEERFRKINVLRPGEELSVGSSILSSDCICDRVVSYDEMDAPNSYTNSSDKIKTNKQSKYASNTPNRNRIYSNTSAFIASAEDSSPNKVEASYDASSKVAQGNSEPIITSAPNQTATDEYRTSSSNSITSRNSNVAPAAARATYMTADELVMLDEINLLRSNPAGYIQYVEQYRRELQRYDIKSSAGSPYPTIDELIAELKRTPALPLLEPTPCLYDVAKKHGKYQQSIETLTHDGPGFIQPFERIIESCKEIGMILGNENLVTGVPSIRGSVIELLVDHGVSKRGHRKNLLNPRWKYGVTYKVGNIGQSPHSWVQKFGFN